MKKIFFIFLLPSVIFAQELLLLSKFDKDFFEKENLNEYLMSEKLDGVRGIWNGHTLTTRKNYIIKTPEFFTKDFPPFMLDGELWIKRNDFDTISSLIRKNSIDEDIWKQVSYNVFDVPQACEDFHIKECNLENRLMVLKQYLQRNPQTYIKIIPQISVENKEKLENFYQQIIKNKGEGIVIRKNDTPYERKRSIYAMKLKPYEDAECEIIGYTQGKGKYKGKIGAVLCKMLDNKAQIIKIGSGLKDKDRKNPPPIGTIITYKFNGLTKNKLPRFPVFLRIRDNKS